MAKERAAKPAEKPVSLHPLKFEQAVEALLEVRPKRRTQPRREVKQEKK